MFLESSIFIQEIKIRRKETLMSKREIRKRYAITNIYYYRKTIILNPLKAILYYYSLRIQIKVFLKVLLLRKIICLLVNRSNAMP